MAACSAAVTAAADAGSTMTPTILSSGAPTAQRDACAMHEGVNEGTFDTKAWVIPTLSPA